MGNAIIKKPSGGKSNQVTHNNVKSLILKQRKCIEKGH